MIDRHPALLQGAPDVLEAIELGVRQRAAVQLPEDAASAFGPEIEREKTVGHAAHSSERLAPGR